MASESKPGSRPAGRRCVVSGRVQGVYYRGSARERARLIGIVGHARNLADGTVEVIAYGDEHAVLEFIAWLRVGPSAAKVAGVTVQIVELDSTAWPASFTTS
jgi:acylphosphatase